MANQTSNGSTSRVQRLSATAFVLLLLDASGRLSLNEELLHSLAYLIQSQMKESCYPKMAWTVKANMIHSEEICRGIKLARKQGLITAPPLVNLTPTGTRHCSLLGVSVEHCRGDLIEATVATIGLSRQRLHKLCTAAAAIATGMENDLTDTEVIHIVDRHSRFMRKAAKI